MNLFAICNRCLVIMVGNPSQTCCLLSTSKCCWKPHEECCWKPCEHLMTASNYKHNDNHSLAPSTMVDKTSSSYKNSPWQRHRFKYRQHQSHFFKINRTMKKGRIVCCINFHCRALPKRYHNTVFLMMDYRIHKLHTRTENSTVLYCTDLS